MIERTAGTSVVDAETLPARLADMKVREIFFADGMWGAGLVSGYTPRREEWEARTPQRLGADIEQALAVNSLRIYTKKGDGLMRRRPTATRFRGAFRALPDIDHPIGSAEITGVQDIYLRGGRTLPILQLMELGNPREEAFVISLADMAHRLQWSLSELEVS